MKDTQFITWLKDHNLFSIVNRYFEPFKSILTHNIKTKNKLLLIVGDLGTKYGRTSAIMMGCYLLAAKRLGISYKLVFQKPKKRNVPADNTLIESFVNLIPNNCIVLCLSGKLGSLKKLGKSFRKYITFNNHMFLSTTGLRELSEKNFSYLINAINVDYLSIIRKGAKLKRILDEGKVVRIITDAGTNLKISIEGMIAISNTGVYSKFGGNLPGGEVYIPPKKDYVEGSLVIDGSSKIMNSTILVKKPIKLFISKGKVKRLSGGKEADELRDTFKEAEKRAKYPWGIRRIGELGIGINPNAKVIGPTIINEKTLGTAHVGIGSNAWFGGTIYAITHLDQVFHNPKIWVDGKKVIIKG